jgi:hypothetical protein
MFVGPLNTRSSHIEPEHLGSALSASQVSPFIGRVNYLTGRIAQISRGM